MRPETYQEKAWERIVRSEIERQDYLLNATCLDAIMQNKGVLVIGGVPEVSDLVPSREIWYAPTREAAELAHERSKERTVDEQKSSMG